MTVITAIVSKAGTAHASDSYITEVDENGDLKVLEDQETKIVKVEAWRGVMAYWGLATCPTYDWCTLDWLRARANEAHKFPSAEAHAQNIQQQLNAKLWSMQFRRPTDGGIGIHYSVYEYVDGYWIPELFLLSTFADISYQVLHPDGVHLSRETFHHVAAGIMKGDNRIQGRLPALALGDEFAQAWHRESQYRRVVQAYLSAGGMLYYNNGDPVMFNPIANAVLQSMQTLEARGELVDVAEPATYRKLAYDTVSAVCTMQRDFARPKRQRVGGKVHDIVITPGGVYDSRSGDAS